LCYKKKKKKKEKKKELQASPWKSTLWSTSSERIRAKDLGYNLDNAAPIPVELVDKSKWMLDFDTVKCLDCGFAFDSVIRRHHCRACGAIFCETCSPEIGLYHGQAVRICADCYYHAKAAKKTADQEAQTRRALVVEALKKRKSEILIEKGHVLIPDDSPDGL